MSPRDPLRSTAGTDGSKVRERAHWGSVSRGQVVEAAIKAIRDGHYEAMTIRSLAADLDVAPMTLYRHIRDRDDLLEEVADVLLSKSWRPRKKYDKWQDWIVDVAKRFRQLLVSQPAVLHVYLSHPVGTPVALDRMKTVLGVLRNAGFDEDAAHRTYGTLHTYTIGFAALEASRSNWISTNKSIDATMRQLAGFTTTKQFVLGLEILLSGMEHSL